MFKHKPRSNLLSSQLLNEESFYTELIKDLNNSLYEVIIESPFITNKRLGCLLPALQKLKERKVRVIINTKDPSEHKDYLMEEAYRALAILQSIGVQVLYTAGHHRKLVIVDRQILYEGSLNILSQNNSCEVMRRIESNELAWQMVNFIQINKFLC